METSKKNLSRLINLSKKIERYIIQMLIALMAILLVLASLQLAYEVIKAIITSDSFLINLDNLMNLFGIFLLVLIGIELLDTIKVYFREHVIHVEIVLLVAIIAVARKVIVMDFDKYSGLEVIAIGFIVLAMAGSYYLIKKTGGCGFWPKESEEDRETIVKEKAIDQGEDERLIEREKVIKSHISEKPADPEKVKKMKEERTKGEKDHGEPQKE